MKPIYSPDPVRFVTMRGPSDGEFSLTWAARNEALIGARFGGPLVLAGSVSGTSKLRLGLLDENTERIFCLNHFLGVCSLFGGVDMARGRLRDRCYRMSLWKAAEDKLWHVTDKATPKWGWPIPDDSDGTWHMCNYCDTTISMKHCICAFHNMLIKYVILQLCLKMCFRCL